MEKKFKKSVFIFRRDLRYEDNTGLNAALEHSEKVLPCFIFDPRQINGNDYFSAKGFRFMLESLDELGREIEERGGKLLFFSGNPAELVKKLAGISSIQAVFVNNDYTPFSIERDRAIESSCKNLGLNFFSYHDALLNPPENCLKKDGEPYTIFTPFYKNAKKFPVQKPMKNKHSNFSDGKGIGDDGKILHELLSKFPENKYLAAGRKAGLEKLAIAKTLSNYEHSKDFPSMNGASGLSAHLKFGTISAREAYWGIRGALTEFHPLLRQLYWRDFFTHIAFHFPKVFGAPFNGKYGRIAWGNSEKKIGAWKNGLTGFPIVDAGMRELNETGIMHNRVRMVASSFLVKDLHIDWRIGEKYFAQRLADYDPALNNGNWQWSASTGCDAQPYFRIFNPWSQQEKFDPDCAYIKKWVPELQLLTPKEIHSLRNDFPEGLKYPRPMVDHKKEAESAKHMYASTI